MAEKTIKLFAPIAAINARTRIVKIVNILVQEDWKVDFFGWQRQLTEQHVPYNSSCVTEKTILSGGGYKSNKTLFFYPLWMVIVFLHVLFKSKRNQTLYCLGFETAFPALLATYIRGGKILFDDADRFSLIFKFPPMINTILVKLEKWTSERSTVHIVPGYSRYEWKHDKMVQLRNTPCQADFDAAKNLETKRPNVDLVVNINGWVGDTRGAPIFLKALNKLQENKTSVHFIFCGRVDSKAGEALINHEMLTYHGIVPQIEALRYYYVSDTVLTYYDPRIPINKKAESNKWGDCTYFGTPFIVNEEVITAKNFIKHDAAWSLAYSDVDGLVELLINLANNKELLNEKVKNILDLKTTYPIFDVAFQTVMEKLK